MGIGSIAVYSEADRDCLHARMADEAVCIGPAPSAQSYLNMSAVISAGLMKGAEAVHPGYGFLAENAGFVRACQDSGLTFIGPSPDAIDRMGDKATARETMANAGVPVVPGSDGPVTSEAEARVARGRRGLPGDHQGFRRRRRSRHEGGGSSRAAGRAATPQPRPRPLSASATTRSTWRNTSHGPGTWSSRSSRTRRATPCICTSAIAPSSGAIRSSSRKRPARPSRRSCARQWARQPSRPSGPWTT